MPRYEDWRFHVGIPAEIAAVLRRNLGARRVLHRRGAKRRHGAGRRQGRARLTRLHVVGDANRIGHPPTRLGAD